MAGLVGLIGLIGLSFRLPAVDRRYCDWFVQDVTVPIPTRKLGVLWISSWSNCQHTGTRRSSVAVLHRLFIE